MSKKTLVQGVAVTAAVVIIGIFFYLLPMFQTQSSSTSGSQDDQAAAVQTPSNGLIVHDDVVGTGDEAVNGSTISVNYVGTLSDGTKFDSSYDRNQAFSFVLGSGQVIQGWDQGVLGMKVGGKRTLVIPPALGYGSQGIGPIPPNATLVFQVELLAVGK